MNKILIAAIAFLLCSNDVGAQNDGTSKSELKYDLSPDGSKYIKATVLNQTWVRWNESNPGTLVNGKPSEHTFDIGLRRTRMQLFGQLTDHVFFYAQFGMNNFNFLSQNAGNRKLQPFFHDVLGEIRIFKGKDLLKIGGGLTITNGLSRFTQPSIGTIMTTDVPVFLQVTVDQTDEFARRLALYARGQVGKLDYRMAIADPFPVQTNGQAIPVLGKDATFTSYGHSYQYSGLVIYNIFDKEPHTTPYMAGTYLGDKKVLNVEGGVIYQDQASWTTNGIDTVYHAMLHWGAAMYADMPVQNNKYVLSAYAGYFYTDYGPNYIRINGIMNPANGSNDPGQFNGAGNAYPMFGTGGNIYVQAGFRLPKNLLKENGTLMPYFSYRRSDYEKLNDPVQIYNVGINWLMNRHQSKLSLNYELRSCFGKMPDGIIEHITNKSSIWLQYQVSF